MEKVMVVNGLEEMQLPNSEFSVSFYELLTKISEELKIGWNILYSDINKDEYNNILENAKECISVMWFVDGDNYKSVKKAAPKAVVIGIQNSNEKDFLTLLNDSLARRDNLTILVENKDSNEETYMFYDPLGTLWYKGNDKEALVKRIIERVIFLVQTHRKNTFKTDGINEIPNNVEFFDYVHEVAEIFHKTIQHTDGVTRLLGNASFRGKQGLIYASKRDVDKALISRETFVPSYIGLDGRTYYYGNKKPSKDTIVQLNLYSMLPNINYIVHSHCYVQDAPFTKLPVPCGSMEEIDEVKEVIEKTFDKDYNKEYYAINLVGHGCLVFGNTLDDLKTAKYLTRQLPEVLVEIQDGYETTQY